MVENYYLTILNLVFIMLPSVIDYYYMFHELNRNPMGAMF